ncbi:Alpha/beta hydrolase fold-1 [Dactylonectria estremocensis]|uniref:Alpha/beta hydrolase fold-1 n=1 Tax=Dactylonectria estremocensis TaxID=1079267 RepID=A0A9P9FCQ6_9HYPO|nr:Alpha/beta hydrolase fold-1 [Dactylonectria estremocensis]
MAAQAERQPTVVLVPGAWQRSSGFDTVQQKLGHLGYPTVLVDHLSTGAEPPTIELTDDVNNLRQVLQRLVDEERDVVVIAHSYGGVVASCAVEGFDVAELSKSGKNGGVIMLAYLSAFVLPKGKSLMDGLGGQWLPWQRVEGDYCRTTNEAEVFYNDLSVPEQRKWIATMTHMPVAVFKSKSTYEPWHVIPCMYIFCTKDNAIPIVSQTAMASQMGSSITTYEIVSSHSPFLSSPDEVVGGIELAARTGEEMKGLI